MGAIRKESRKAGSSWTRNRRVENGVDAGLLSFVRCTVHWFGIRVLFADIRLAKPETNLTEVFHKLSG